MAIRTYLHQRIVARKTVLFSLIMLFLAFMGCREDDTDANLQIVGATGI